MYRARFTPRPCVYTASLICTQSMYGLGVRLVQSMPHSPALAKLSITCNTVAWSIVSDGKWEQSYYQSSSFPILFCCCWNQLSTAVVGLPCTD